MRLILLASFCMLFTISAAQQVHATTTSTDIQMLPPLDFGGSVCGGSNAGILYWDGTTAIKCIPGFSGDSDGNITVSGAIRTGTAGTLIYGATPGNFGGNETVITTANGAGGDNDEIWIGPRVDGISGHVKLKADDITIVSGSGSRGPAGYSFFSNGRIGIGTTSPMSALDMSAQTDALSMPAGTTAQQPAAPVAGMTRFNTSISKLEYYDGTRWVPVATSRPQLTSAVAPWPPGLTGPGWPGPSPTVNYLDCPAGWTAISCLSVESPSGKAVCDASVGTDPNTGNSACIQAGCGQWVPSDPGYWTTVACMKL